MFKPKSDLVFALSFSCCASVQATLIAGHLSEPTLACLLQTQPPQAQKHKQHAPTAGRAKGSSATAHSAAPPDGDHKRKARDEGRSEGGSKAAKRQQRAAPQRAPLRPSKFEELLGDLNVRRVRAATPNSELANPMTPLTAGLRVVVHVQIGSW